LALLVLAVHTFNLVRFEHPMFRNRRSQGPSPKSYYPLDLCTGWRLSALVDRSPLADELPAPVGCPLGGSTDTAASTDIEEIPRIFARRADRVNGAELLLRSPLPAHPHCVNRQGFVVGQMWGFLWVPWIKMTANSAQSRSPRK
jgi:hypothetical protein